MSLVPLPCSWSCEGCGCHLHSQGGGRNNLNGNSQQQVCNRSSEVSPPHPFFQVEQQRHGGGICSGASSATLRSAWRGDAGSAGPMWPRLLGVCRASVLQGSFLGQESRGRHRACKRASTAAALLVLLTALMDEAQLQLCLSVPRRALAAVQGQ